MKTCYNYAYTCNSQGLLVENKPRYQKPLRHQHVCAIDSVVADRVVALTVPLVCLHYVKQLYG